MPSVLLDTNVLIYVVDARNPQRQERAIALLVTLAKNGCGCLSVQNLSEFMNASINKLKLPPHETIVQVENWQRIFPVFDLTPSIVLEAGRGVRDHALSYYDAQIWACARLNHIPLILSEDFQNGQVIEAVRCANPFVANFRLEEWL